MTPGGAARVVALETALAAMAMSLAAAGRALPAPPLTSWSAATRWYASVGPDAAVASLVRVGALGVTVWLIVGIAAQLVVAAGAPAAIRAIADLIAPRSLQRFVRGLAGFSLSAGLAVVVPSAGIPSAEPAGVAVLHLVAEASPPPGTATLRYVPVPAPAATPVPVAPAAPPTSVPSASPSPVADTVVVEPGDSLWSIAAEVLAERGIDVSDDAVVEGYWRRLVDANRRNLVAPANPDLIFPGQAIALPSA